MTTLKRLLKNGQRVIQNGYVVDKLEPAMEQWLALGVGPFIRIDVDLEDGDYRGTREPIRARFGLAQAGDLQIELIEPLGDRPSAYRDSVAPGVTALHHIMVTTTDYDGDMAALRSGGIAIANEADLGGTRFAYADTRELIGCMFEIVEDGEGIRSINSAVEQAAKDWDGSDPIRVFVADE